MKLEYHKLLSPNTFNFNLRRYMMDSFAALVSRHGHHFQPQELSNAMWSYAVLSHYPGVAVQVDSIKTRVETAYCSSA